MPIRWPPKSWFYLYFTIHSTFAQTPPERAKCVQKSVPDVEKLNIRDGLILCFFRPARWSYRPSRCSCLNPCGRARRARRHADRTCCVPAGSFLTLEISVLRWATWKRFISKHFIRNSFMPSFQGTVTWFRWVRLDRRLKGTLGIEVQTIVLKEW